eukprot:3941961-Rhodomonas_salina.19
MALLLPCYAMSSTEIGYAATRSSRKKFLEARQCLAEWQQDVPKCVYTCVYEIPLGAPSSSYLHQAYLSADGYVPT